MNRLNVGLGGVANVVCCSMLFLTLATLGTAQEADPHPAKAAGLKWKRVHGGEGFATPVGLTGASLHAVAWAGDRFVAVGQDGAIAHSVDGDRWEEAGVSEISGTPTLRDVARGAPRFVAVGGPGTFVYSDDGHRWRRGSSVSESVHGVTWGDDRYVAVGHRIWHSTDGRRWRASRSPPESLADVVWSGERYVAVGRNGLIMHSEDGSRWAQASENDSSSHLHGAAWNGERFVAVGDDGTIVHSRDGDDWERATVPATREAHRLNGVVWGGDRFVAVGSNGAIVYSTDGDRWQPASDHPKPHLEDIAWNGERFVAVGTLWPWHVTIMHSTDGDRWEHAIAGAAEALPGLSAVAGSGDRLVAVGGRGTVLRSGDAESWEEATDSATSDLLHDVAWNGDRFVAVASGGVIVHSVDGDRWRRASDRATSEGLHGIAWSGERFVSVGEEGTIVHSRNGDRWGRASHTVTSEMLIDVAWSGERFVAAGPLGTIVHSVDGDRWELATVDELPEHFSLRGVAWGGGRFVAVGWNAILHSRDGHRWEQARDRATTSQWLHDVAWSGDRFVAVGWDGTNGMMLHSIDGDIWETVNEPGSADELHAIAWAGTRFIAVGNNGTIVVTRSAADGYAPPSLVGYIVRMDMEAIRVPARQTRRFAKGERINEIEHLPGGSAARFRSFFAGEGWSDWITGTARRRDYRRPEPDVGQVETYTYANDGSTPADTLTLTFADETGGTWENQNHTQGVRSGGTFTLRKVPAG